MESKKISVCIITKNECDKLEDCLNHLLPYTKKAGHEIVVVDTGSTDNTVEMCKKYTDSIYHFKWIDDFSAARNYAAKMAKNDWILAIDSDENVTEWDEKDVQDFINKDVNIIATIIQKNTCGIGDNKYTSDDRAARFYNRTSYHFEKPIHEQLEPNDNSGNHQYCSVKINADHKAYSGSKEDLIKKSTRNITLLKEELKKNPHNPYVLFQLGQSFYMIEDFEQALYYYELGLEEDVDPNLEYVSSMVESYGYTLLKLKQFNVALNLQGVYDTFSKRADFVFLMGSIYLNNGFIDQAVVEFKKATTYEKCQVDGVNSYKAWYNLGVIYECSNQKIEAIEYYKKCGEYKPAKDRLAGLV